MRADENGLLVGLEQLTAKEGKTEGPMMLTDGSTCAENHEFENCREMLKRSVLNIFIFPTKDLL